MASKPSRSWAEIEVESQEELNDPRRGDDISTSFSSEPSGTPSLTEDVSAGSLSEISSGHRLSKGSKQKLQNKPLCRDQLERSHHVDHHIEWEGTSSDGSSWDGSASLPGAAGIAAKHVAPAVAQQGPVEMGGWQYSAAIPLERQEGQPTVGSVLHENGSCKPCLFVRTDVGCQSGEACKFCHLQHRRRCCKGKRDRYKKHVARMQDAAAATGSGEPREGHSGHDMAPESKTEPHPKPPPPNTRAAPPPARQQIPGRLRLHNFLAAPPPARNIVTL